MFSSRKLFRTLALALLCGATLPAVFAAGAKGDAAPKPPPFPADEELFYQADFSRLMLRGIEIAEFRFTVGRKKQQPPAPASRGANGANGQLAAQPAADDIVFTGDLRAKGWFRKLFGIDFHYNHESIVAPGSMLIQRTTKLDEQGKRVRTSEAVFDRATNLVTWTERNPNDPQAQPRVVRNVLEGAAHDFISAIYFLRTQTLKPGQTLELVVSDAGVVYRVPVRVGERKTLKTLLGRVPVLRVDLGVFGAGRLINDRKGEMSLWITDDARRIPVRARLNADVGTLDIKLKKVSAAKQP